MSRFVKPLGSRDSFGRLLNENLAFFLFFFPTGDLVAGDRVASVKKPVVARVNGQLWDLSREINEDCSVEFLVRRSWGFFFPILLFSSWLFAF